jgi:hypothetical protein
MPYNLSLIPSLANSLSDFERDCAITVALKIVDDTCKMDEYEKDIFMRLYDAIESKQSSYFAPTVFELIEQARKAPSAQIYAAIKTLRQDAMDKITRPKMKAFKAGLRSALL